MTAQQGSNQLGIKGKSINQPMLVRVSGDIGGKMVKYSLTREAGRLLYNHDPKVSMKDQHRTCWCHRGTVSATGSIAVKRQTDGKSARMHGVTTCKSVWACPTCSAKICAVRQAELSDGMKYWVAQGGYTWLMTLTFPHDRDMPLDVLLPKFGKAKAYFKNCKTYKRILAKGVRKGSVSSLEVTLGENGWHPHQHDLVFAAQDAFGVVREGEGGRLTSAAIDELKAAWYMALRKADLCEQHQMSDVLAHGLDVRGGQYAAEYIAKFGREQKWGLSREVTMHAAKVGSDTKGAHPFQLLAWAAEGDGLAAQQFREYAAAFEGKRMLSWSRGLKKDLTGQDEMTDEQAADAAMPAEETAGYINSAALSVLQSRKLLGNFLGYVAQYCTNPDTAQAEIDAYIEQAKEMTRTARGEVKVKMWSTGFMHVDQEKVAA
jgi:hypothetical protein